MNEVETSSVLFQETNYGYISKNGKPNPQFDFLITRIFIFPLILFFCLFVILTIRELQHGHLFIPYIFQATLLAVTTLAIFIAYPKRTIILSERKILLKEGKIIRKSLPIEQVIHISIQKNQNELTISSAYTVIFESPRDHLTCVIHAKNRFEKAIKEHFPQFHYSLQKESV